MLALGGLGDGVRYAFTTRHGGVSQPPFDALNLSLNVGDDPVAVTENRRLLLHRLGIPAAVWLSAQHGCAVSVVDQSDVAEPAVDATVTTKSGLALGALSADCALIVLGDITVGVVGVVHCGRPGLIAGGTGVVASSVAAMCDLGATHLRAVIGPTVCADCYEVPQAMADDVWSAVPATRAVTRLGRPAIDIVAGVHAQLDAVGVQTVRHVGGCTVEDPTLFSFRRDQVTGRMGALVWRSQ